MTSHVFVVQFRELILANGKKDPFHNLHILVLHTDAHYSLAKRF